MNDEMYEPKPSDPRSITTGMTKDLVVRYEAKSVNANSGNVEFRPVAILGECGKWDSCPFRKK